MTERTITHPPCWNTTFESAKEFGHSAVSGRDGTTPALTITILRSVGNEGVKSHAPSGHSHLFTPIKTYGFQRSNRLKWKAMAMRALLVDPCAKLGEQSRFLRHFLMPMQSFELDWITEPLVPSHKAPRIKKLLQTPAQNWTKTT